MRTHRRSAYTFVEVLAAMLFMAIVIPVTLHALMLSNRVTSGAVHKRQAAQLATMVLNEQIVTGTWADGDQSGDFGDDWPGFRWESSTDDWSEGTMRVLTVSVSYTIQDHGYTESLSTLVIEETE
jgi:hypothetical protein